MGIKIEEITLDSLTADPGAAPDGCMWYRSDLNELRAQIDGTVKTVLTAGSEAAPVFTEAAGAAVAAGSNGVWEVVTLTGAPANSVVQVFVSLLADGRATGVRQVGSLLSRLLTFKKGGSSWTVNTDGLGQIEIYAEDTGNTTFYYWGKLE